MSPSENCPVEICIFASGRRARSCFKYVYELPFGTLNFAIDAATTFTVTYTPASNGNRSAALQIPSNDLDENPFDVTLEGTALDRMIFSEWAASYGLSGSAALVTVDDDGDGVTLLTEYAFNLDPTIADYVLITPNEFDTKGLPSIRVVNGQLEIQFLRRRNDPDLTSEPQFGNELT